MMSALFICSGIHAPPVRVCRSMAQTLVSKKQKTYFLFSERGRNFISQRGEHVRGAVAQSTIVASSSVDYVSYTIHCKPHPVEFGQSLAIVSNVHGWDVGSAVVLEWKEGDTWEGCVDVPVDAGVFEFKLVTVADDGVLEWEGSENKVVKVFKKDVKKGASVECEWNSGNVLVISADGKTKKTVAKKKKSSSVSEPEVAEPVVPESAEPEVVEPVVSESAEPEVEEPLAEAPQQEEEEKAEAPQQEPLINNDGATLDVYEEGDVVTYSFDDGSGGESAAEMAKRMYG